MAFKQLWARTTARLTNRKRGVDYQPQVDDHGLISDESEVKAEIEQEENNHIVVQKVEPKTRSESLEKLEGGFDKLIGQLDGINNNLSRQLQQNEELMSRIERGFKLGLSDSARETTVPRPFIMPSTAVTAPDSEIRWPLYSEEIDYEIELAVVIGKTAKSVSSAEALDFVAGYTIVNDISARSITFKASRKQRPWDEFYDWLNGKWADGFCPMGPYLLTSDEVSDVQNLDMELTVNNKTRQKANTSQMIYPVADIVSFLSHLFTLEPGDCIATGTPSGVAVATGNFLKGGDKIECKIEKLGTLTNTLGSKPQKFYKPLEQP